MQPPSEKIGTLEVEIVYFERGPGLGGVYTIYAKDNHGMEDTEFTDNEAFLCKLIRSLQQHYQATCSFNALQDTTA